jgi:MYXO-CTERM domain-containing protein
LRSGATADERLAAVGMTLDKLGDKVTVRQVKFGSEAAKYGLGAGDQITAVLTPADRPSRYWFALPGLLALGVIVLLQRRRAPRAPRRKRAVA